MTESGQGAREATVALVTPPRVEVASAVMVDEAGCYLLQLRDDIPGVAMAGHWGAFGGIVEAGETPEAAMRRELVEELAWSAREMFPLMVSVHAVWPGTPVMRKHFFVVPFRAAEIAGMVLGEGSGMQSFTLDAVCRLDRIVPWDLTALLAHRHHRRYWPERPTPEWLAR